ncbi:MAG: hypothetical protein R2941_04250 [Desulfobacterales bacterium]
MRNWPRSIRNQNKVENLSQVNNDMNNLLTGTGISTVLVDHQLCIVRIHLVIQPDHQPDSDRCGAASEPHSNLLGYGTLVEDTQDVLLKLIPIEKEVQTADGMCYTMRDPASTAQLTM